MKSIKKIKESSKAIAGTALLVGATLAGGAAMASNHGGSSGSGDGMTTLGDYPHPFIGEDGTVQSTIVMGADAKATDVVAATNIAGQLGNDAFTTEMVSAGGGASASWSATSGITLDTSNDDLFFGDNLDNVRDTLTSEQLSSLKDTTFQDDNGDETDIENYLYPGSLQTTFGKPDDRNNEDPIHYVSNPADPSQGDNLFRLQANFEDQIDFTHDDVEDEEIQLFGNTYTISTDTNSNELVLYGSQDTTSVASGESTTITINGQEHTFEVVGVTGPNTAAFRVDGELQQKDEEQTVTVDGTEVRLSDVIQTNSDNSQGVVTFAIGNNELVLRDGEAIEDGDGNDIDGTKVNFQGLQTGGGNDGDNEQFAASGIEIYVGAQNDDHEYIQAGNSYSHELFPDFTFHYGGLAPNAMDADSENVHQVEFSTSGDDTVTVGMTADGSSTSLEALHNSDPTSDQSYLLGDDDGDQYVVKEGASVYEDEYVAADAGDFAHIWEVTNIDRDTVDSDEGATGEFSNGDEATVTLQDAVTGDTVEVDLDAANVGSDDVDYTGTEVIDGQTYHITLDGQPENTDNNPDREGSGLKMAWGTGAVTSVNAADDDTVSTGATDPNGATTLFAPVDTASGSAIALTEEVTAMSSSQMDVTADGEGADGDSDTVTATFELPSTESTDAKSQNVDVKLTDAGNAETNDDDTVADDVEVDVDPSANDGFELTFSAADGSVADSTGPVAFQVGQTHYTATLGTTTATSDLSSISLDVGVEQGLDGAATAVASKGVLTVLPEDDNDNEESYFVGAGYDGQDGQITVNNADYSGAMNNRQSSTLESNDDVTAYVDYYGAYSEYDSDEQKSFTLNIPSGQSTVGAAFTTQGGSISSEGGGSGSVQTKQPTGWSTQDVALDSDSSVSQAKQNSNLILVGGPAANSLVSELASANKTWDAGQYTDGQGLLDLVPNAFSEGNHALVVAGYSGEDTRQAGAYLANYAQHQDMLAGQDNVTINTAEGTVVQ